jgi:hypothetical protein
MSALVLQRSPGGAARALYAVIMLAWRRGGVRGSVKTVRAATSGCAWDVPAGSVSSFRVLTVPPCAHARG